MEEDYGKAVKTFEELVTKFGENPKKTAPEDFFSVWKNFVTR